MVCLDNYSKQNIRAVTLRKAIAQSNIEETSEPKCLCIGKY